MKIKNFVQFKKTQGFESLKADIDKALEKVAAKYGVTARAGNIKYDDTFANIVVTFSVVGEDGVVQTPYVADWKRMCHLYGFEQTDLGRAFTSQGYTFTIVGLKASSGKYPIVAKRQDGKMMRFTTDVKNLMQ